MLIVELAGHAGLRPHHGAAASRENSHWPMTLPAMSQLKQENHLCNYRGSLIVAAGQQLWGTALVRSEGKGDKGDRAYR